MKGIVRYSVVAGLMALLAVSVGCRRAYMPPASTMVLDPAATNIVPGSAGRIDTLKDDDVLVSVNGRGVTKRVFEQLSAIRQAGLAEKKDANNYVIDKQMEQWRMSFAKTFVMQRLLVDEAFRLGLVTTNEVLQVVGKKISTAADKVGKTVDQYLTGLGPRRDFLQYELGIAYTMDKIIHEKIPPKAEVTPEFLQAVRAQVKMQNAEAAATNELMRSRLQGWKGQIIAGNKDFLQLAKKVSDPYGDAPESDDGVWGEFEEGDIDNAAMAAKIFAMKLNEISDVLEDDNGLHLVKVLSITPAVENDNGRIVERERRKLAHIYLEKAPLLIEESDIVLTQDLKRQMQQQAVNAYVTALSTNGIHKIVFPHGARLF